MVTEVESGERIKEEFGTSRYILLFIKQINNKVLLYSPGNYLVINYNGKESTMKKEKGKKKPIFKYSHILRY